MNRKKILLLLASGIIGSVAGIFIYKAVNKSIDIKLKEINENLEKINGETNGKRENRGGENINEW